MIPQHLTVDAVLRYGAQTFQKLIFVSNLVFGDQKAAFLLPWRRTFKLTDSQLAVAKRDSAKALFKSFLDERGGFQVHIRTIPLSGSCCIPALEHVGCCLPRLATVRDLPNSFVTLVWVA